MNENAQPPVAAEDAAWVVVQTPLDVAALEVFCRDLERLYRINPLLEFGVWRATGPDAWRAEWRNLSNNRDEVFDLRRQPVAPGQFRVDYAQGLRQCTWFRIEPRDGGSTLTITDDYSRLPAAERARRLDEVDRSLTAWGRGLYDYLQLERRWGWLPPWRWYMRRLWVPMKPMARRISWMLILINTAFFGLFLFVALIFWLEQRTGVSVLR
jgi:hypothetical protein